MFTLKINSPNKAKGTYKNDVEKWQLFLRGLRYDVVGSGDFDDLTESATKDFQRRYGLVIDGKVGKYTIAKAITLGFEVEGNDLDPSGMIPHPPASLVSPSDNDREAYFGKFSYRSEPKPGNPENIRILGTWENENIVKINIPQLIGVTGAPHTGNVYFHKKMATKTVDLFADWEANGLLHLILTWEGSFVPRFIRNSKTKLSNHAYGSAFDINYEWNKRGATPTLPGLRGSVRELVPIANQHGFFWGGHFNGTKDGMHFEFADF